MVDLNVNFLPLYKLKDGDDSIAIIFYIVLDNEIIRIRWFFESAAYWKVNALEGCRDWIWFWVCNTYCN
jgi:hypothetical protein